MDVFISWSGKKSEEIGKALYDWLPDVIQVVKPFFSKQDIVKGDVWFNSISNKLQGNIGILCLTKDNLQAPWIMYEAGALSKKLDIARVMPILFDVAETEVKPPLSQLQLTPFNQTQMSQLVINLLKLVPNSNIREDSVRNAFEKNWDSLNEKVQLILSKDEQKAPKRSDRDLIEEILTTVRSQSSHSERRVLPLSLAEKLLHSFDELIQYVDENSVEENPGYPNFIFEIEKSIRYIIKRTNIDIDMQETLFAKMRESIDLYYESTSTES